MPGIDATSQSMLDAQKAQSDELFARQVQQNMQTERTTAQTNMEKTRHDAMMAVISNFKS